MTKLGLLGTRVVLAAFVLLGSVSCSGAGSDPDDGCQKLLDCCKRLSPALQSQCQAAYDELHRHSDAKEQCDKALAAIGTCATAVDVDGAVADAAAADVLDGTTSSPCSIYIECVSQTTPAGLAAVLAAYGKNGNCWLQGDPALCDSACRKGTIAAHLAFRDATACDFCEAAADCPAPTPACNTATHRCVECQSDADCTDSSNPACDRDALRCIACTADFHCGDSAVCDVQTAQCVQCKTRGDCQYGLTCDLSAKKCRSCQSDDECKPDVCHSGSCVQCKADAQCGGAKPRCGPTQICVQCTGDTDCGAGICDPFLNTCCGANACAGLNAECGYAIDPACFLIPIPCGPCPGGHTCVKNTCLLTPPKTCSAQSCPGKACGYVPEKNAYECIAYSSDCSKAAPSCAPGYFCASRTSSITGEQLYYCTPYCLTAQDCPGAGVCSPLQGPTSYGRCE